MSALTAAFWVVSIGGLAFAAAHALPTSPTRLAVLAILAVGGFVTESFAVRVGPGNRAEVSAGGIVIILAAVLLDRTRDAGDRSVIVSP